MAVSAASGLAVNEGGTATYTVVLGSQPTADVTITPFSGEGAKVSVSPVSHTFTPSAWKAPLTFTVSGLADNDSADESVTIGHAVSSDDWRYAAVLVNQVTVSVSDTTPKQQGPPNQPPTLASTIADATIFNERGTHGVSLSGVFSDADSDALTVAAESSDDTKATVSVAAGYASLTVTAQARGTATITVTASDGRGGTVNNSFTVKVKAAPVVVSAIADMHLEVGGTEWTQEVTLSDVFSDADGDDLSLSAAASNYAVADAFVFQDTLTIVSLSDGTATITVTAEDTDGNTVSDTFDVSVLGPPTPVVNLRCVAQTDRVLFYWDAPEWSGAEVYAYDYERTLPGGATDAGRILGLQSLSKRGEYQPGGEASFSVKTVYKPADGNEVYSAAESLTCTVE